MDVVGADHECEFIRYADGRNYVERCTGLGKVSDCTIDRAAAEQIFPTSVAAEVLFCARPLSGAPPEQG